MDDQSQWRYYTVLGVRQPKQRRVPAIFFLGGAHGPESELLYNGVTNAYTIRQRNKQQSVA